ncbi:MAG: glycosyltransferase family 2 protein [Clostridia bacterium]|nr:glycosyltransferase family 2 protein [Clostridia bacterium]
MKYMSRFQILCVTMKQRDFSKIEEMNVHSDIICANQWDKNDYQELTFEGHTAKMVTTDTRGVGKNRNIALIYADAEICLFADDDVRYIDNVEEVVLSEFDKHPDADVFIFHFSTDSETRKERQYSKTRPVRKWDRMPWAGFRIAVRLSSVRKANVWFNTLYGGGCVFPSGEDSLWLNEAKSKGLKMYVSDQTIGTVSFENSTWFTGYDEKYYYSKGTFCRKAHRKTEAIWHIYYALRIAGLSELTFLDRMKWIKNGRRGYDEMLSYEEYKEKYDNK